MASAVPAIMQRIFESESLKIVTAAESECKIEGRAAGQIIDRQITQWLSLAVQEKYRWVAIKKRSEEEEEQEQG